MSPSWTVTWVAGPDAGARKVLGCGSYIVGRSMGAEVRCDDPAIESHHVLIEIGAASVSANQLSGRLPVRLDGEPLEGVAPITGAARLEIGHSILALSPGDLTAPGHGTNGANIATTPPGRVLVRRPRAAAAFQPEPVSPLVENTGRGETSGGLLPALLALGGAGLLAILLHEPMFLLFGAIGAIAAFGTWGGHRISVFRRRRHDVKARANDIARFDREVEAQRAAFVRHHLVHDSTPVAARHVIEGLTADLWVRRRNHPDSFAVAVGSGTVAWTPVLIERPGVRSAEDLGTMSLLPAMPMVADIGPECRLAIRGDVDRTTAIARSLLVQLAANCGPADVRFLVVTERPVRWRWLQHVPHATTAAGLVAVVGEDALWETVSELEVAPTMHLVVITDAPELLSARTSPLRRALNAERSTALIVLLEGGDGIPHVCSSLLDLSGPTHARWHADAALTSLPTQARWFGISERSATLLADCLAGLIDPEDPLSGVGAVPRDVTLLSLLPSPEPAAIAAAWVAGGADPAPRTPLGVAADGVVDIDLVRDGPHTLLAGTTGAGKSELLRSLVAGLAAGSSPDLLNFVLVDYKGGATFDGCAELPHVVGVVTDLDEHLASRALRSLHAELRRREQLLRHVGTADLVAYRRVASAPAMPRLVVIIDEFASLVAEQPEFLHALVGIAQRGRSLGVHLILATQRPNGVISDDIRANTNLRLALRLHDAADALDVVGDRAPAMIPRGLAGRAVVRLGPDEVVTFQTARCTTPIEDGDTELERLVGAIRTASEMVGSQPPVSPWLAPLPTDLPADDAALARGVVGLLDDPDGQRMVPLRWSPNDGHLLLFGTAGSGTTSALVLLGTAAIMTGAGCHVWVIDGRGDPAFDALVQSPWCGGVVRLHERERLIRLINRLGQDLAARIASPAEARRPIVVLIDGFELVRASLDVLETSTEFDTLDSIVALGAAHQVVVVAAFDRVAAVPSAVLARCSQRWVFHLTDPMDAIGLGVAVADVPGPQPGRVFITSSGLEAQLVTGASPPSECASGDFPQPVASLPLEVDSALLPSGERRGVDSLLPIGVRFDNGCVCSLDVPDGEHVLIIGPARSGRSTALRRIVHAWREARPNGWWTVVTPRRSVFPAEHVHRSLVEIIDDVPPTGEVLIAVDDAELVDDVDGALAALAACRRPGLLIVAAGKPDSLRHSYGHWAGVVRRSRLGIVTAMASDMDGDLLGASLPRRLPIPVRPGLVWVVADGEVSLTQVAIECFEATPAPRNTRNCFETAVMFDKM